jgi:hypothetical protein
MQKVMLLSHLLACVTLLSSSPDLELFEVFINILLVVEPVLLLLDHPQSLGGKSFL